MESNTDEGESLALKELLQSEGWKVFKAHYEQEWSGDAMEARIERAVALTPLGDQDASNDAAQHVLTAKKHLRALMEWPKLRLAQVSGEPKSRQPFAALRRMGR